MAGAGSLYEVVDRTWPPARWISAGPWTLREGRGGGKRVSSATATGPVTEADIDDAAAAMHDLGQESLFCIRRGDETLDAMLEARGYHILDPVNLYSVPVEHMASKLGRLAAFALDEPLAIMREIWAEGGIGAARLAVMARAAGPKSYLFARVGDRPAGTAFVAIHADTAMIHAVEVLTAQRRQGAGRNLLVAAANWAAEKGARDLALAVTRANAGANALYASLGMALVEQYHYRIEPGQDPS